jgi:hypothetical protein
MKKVLLMALCLGSLSASAQNWNVRLSPLSYLIGLMNVEVNYGVTNNISVGGGLQSWDVELLDVEIGCKSIMLVWIIGWPEPLKRVGIFLVLFLQ